jgi:hypothetical protein
MNINIGLFPALEAAAGGRRARDARDAAIAARATGALERWIAAGMATPDARDGARTAGPLAAAIDAGDSDRTGGVIDRGELDFPAEASA